ncbi:MAG: response regulator [Alphaproteobacteria bacterium]|nr:response regulator [Alphaproteobacteria bacterium]
MSIKFLGIFFLFLSICHASEKTPDNESYDKSMDEGYRGGFNGVRRLRESKSAPSTLETSLSYEEESSTRSVMTASSETYSSRKILLPPFASPLKKGDTIMVLEDSPFQQKMLVNKLKNLGFTVLAHTYGYQACDSALEAAEKDIKISLFLFDFNVPFPAEDEKKYIDKLQLNGGETARLIKEMTIDRKKPFENSVFVCLSATPEDVTGYEDVFWQVRGKLTEVDTDPFFEDVRKQLIVSESTSRIVDSIVRLGKGKACSHFLRNAKPVGIIDAGN